MKNQYGVRGTHLVIFGSVFFKYINNIITILRPFASLVLAFEVFDILEHSGVCYELKTEFHSFLELRDRSLSTLGQL